MNNYKHILIIVLFIFQVFYAYTQNVSFYIQIDDEAIVPEIETIDNYGYLKFKNKRKKQDTIFKNYKIKKFEKAFPTAVTPSLKNVYHVICDNEKLGSDLKTKFKQKIPRLEYLCEPELLYEPNDYNLAASQTNLDLINTKDAWDIVKDIPKVNVAITDTYFNMNHEDLNLNLVGGSNSLPSLGSTSHKHGTLVAGCASAITDNNTGIASIGFDTDLFVSSNWANDSEVLRLAILGYRVISCSWINGCNPGTIQEDLYDEVRNIWGAVCVFGAGNTTSHCGSLSAPVYPAAYSSNISVTSVGHIYDIGTPGQPSNWKDVHNQIIGDSTSSHHHHSTVDICAPGYNVKTTNVDGTYSGAWGTSFATPQVSATLGLIFSVNPCLSADEGVEILLNTTDDIYTISENSAYIGRLGNGRLNVSEAVKSSKESATLFLENENIVSNRNIDSDYYVNISDVNISNNAIVEIIAQREVVITKNFSVSLGSSLSVDGDSNVTISCD